MTTITTLNPATGETLATYDSFTEVQVDATLEAAHTAYVAWAERPLGERSDLLRSVGKLLTERREDYAGLIKHSPNVTGCALAIEQLVADAGAPAGLFATVVLADETLAEMTPRII